MASIVILSADKGRSTATFNCEAYLEKCMDYINNVPSQLLKKVPIPNLKPKHWNNYRFQRAINLLIINYII